MQGKRQTRRGWQAGLAVGAMVGLCGLLGVLQYRWIGEVSVAERERLQRTLQGSLVRVSQDFNEEIFVLSRAMMRGEDGDYVARLMAWHESGRHSGMLREAFVARPEGGEMRLERLNVRTGGAEAVPWPKQWEAMRERMRDRVAGERGRGGVADRGELSLIDLPRFRGERGGLVCGSKNGSCWIWTPNFWLLFWCRSYWPATWGSRARRSIDIVFRGVGILRS